MSIGELAKGVVYSESLKTGWRPPRYIWEASQSKHERIRKKMHILTEGEDVPPPIKTFKVRGTPTCVRSLCSVLFTVLFQQHGSSLEFNTLMWARSGSPQPTNNSVALFDSTCVCVNGCGCNGDQMGHTPVMWFTFYSAGDEVSKGSTGRSEEEGNTSSHTHPDTGTANNVSFSLCREVSWSLRGTFYIVCGKLGLGFYISASVVLKCFPAVN